MELAILPQNKASGGKYKQFTINPCNERNIVDKKIEFFYIGKSSLKIDFLIKTFEGGYAAQSSQKAISILKRISDSSKTPDIIIVDALIGEASIKELVGYISGNSRFSSIPFILEASKMSEGDLKNYKGARYIDEIVFLDEHIKEIVFLDEHIKEILKEKLITKVAFLKKIKKQPQPNIIKENIQKSLDIIVKSKNLLKRVFDSMVAILVMIILSPVFLFIAIAIKFESRGPVFYVSQRAGRGYRIFNFYKFRTMIIGADEKVEQLSHLNHYNVSNENDGPVFFKVINDSRITKVGAFLRNTSMDELPQFFNVLIGDMSLVGNRPLPLYEAAKLTTDEWAERFMAPAGITGLWQIKKRGQDEMSDEERINLDIAYANNYNFMYDLWIMANTPPALIQKSNA